MLGLNKGDSRMLVVILSGTLLAMLNLTFLSPALPSIMEDMGVSATTAQWLTSGYSLVEAVIIPLAAYLMGRFSTRKLFIGGFCIFLVGSLICAVAPNFYVLLAGRMMQAFCTGMVMPMTTTLMLLMFPKERRGTAMGIVGLVIGFAPALGPSVSGLLVDHLGWRALFGVVAVLNVAVIAFSFRFLRNKEGFERSSFDALSVVYSSIGLLCLLYAFSSFSSADNYAIVAALAVVGITFIALFVRRQLTLEQPMLKVNILKTRNYRVAVCVVVIIQCALMGMNVIMPLYIQGVLGLSATMSGVAMLPGALLGAVAGLFAGMCFDKFGVRKVSIPGFCVVLLGAAGMLFYATDSPFVFVVASYTILSLGMQFAMSPVNTWGINSLDNRVIQHAQSLSNTLNQVAGSFGTALLVSIAALGSVAAPGASVLDQTMMGYHLAICVMFALLTVAFAAVVVFTRGSSVRAEGKEGAERGRVSEGDLSLARESS